MINKCKVFLFHFNSLMKITSTLLNKKEGYSMEYEWILNNNSTIIIIFFTNWKIYTIFKGYLKGNTWLMFLFCFKIKNDFILLENKKKQYF